MKKIYFLKVFLLSLLFFIGCSKEEAIDNVDPDVPEVEIPEENMEIAIQNLERVQEAMSPLFLASENAEELAQHLDEIKAMEGVEDAWVGEDAETLWIQIEKGGRIAYHYPIKFSVDESSLLKSSTEAIKKIDTKAVENKNVCIINQVSNDFDQQATVVLCELLKNQFESAGFTATIINCEEFTRDFINTKMPQFGVVFLITHGIYENKKHWLTTGEKLSKWKEDLIYTFGSWFNLDYFPIAEKRLLISESGIGSQIIEYSYLAVSEDYLEGNMNDFSSSNSILFNTACHSLEGDSDLWLVFKDKKVGAYLGLDNTNSIGVKAGVAFFENMLAGMTVSEAFNALPASLKNEKGVHNDKNYDATLHCYPSDCQITLFDKPEVTDEEAVDLGLSVKWGNKNLGASTYTNLGNSYEDYDYDYLYNNSPKLFEWNGAELNLGKTKYDYAYTDLGENWRLPTTEEWMELRDNCKWEADIIDNTPGFRVKGPNGNSIFIPGKFHYEPEGGSYAFEANYFSSRMTSLGVRSIYIVGTKTIFGFNSTAVDEYWIEDTAFIRPVCD